MGRVGELREVDAREVLEAGLLAEHVREGRRSPTARSADRVSSSLARARPSTGASSAASRSETTNPWVRSRCSRMASAFTRRPAVSSAVSRAAPPTSRSRSRSGSHSACQAPAGRSSSAGSAPYRVAASRGARRAAAATRVARTGFALCGIADEPPPDPSASSAISVRERVSTSTAVLPSAPAVNASAPARSAIGERSVCQGNTGSARPSSRAYAAVRARVSSAPKAVKAAKVPAAPPSWAGRETSTACSRSLASSTRDRHPAAFSPKVVGTACWVSVRPGMTVSRCSAASRARWCPVRSRSFRTRTRVRAATSIVAESRMSWLVAPRWTYGPNSAPTAAVRSATSGITGLPPLRARSAIDAMSKSVSPAAKVTAVAAPAGARPRDAWARVSAASESSMARRYAVSLVAVDAGEPARPGASRPVSSATVPAGVTGTPGRPSRLRPEGGCRNGTSASRPRPRSAWRAARPAARRAADRCRRPDRRG